LKLARGPSARQVQKKAPLWQNIFDILKNNYHKLRHSLVVGSAEFYQPTQVQFLVIAVCENFETDKFF
jgi:hypothetical protein